MRPKIIEASIRRTALKKFVPLIIEAEKGGGRCAFLMQVHADGTARGLLLPPEETEQIGRLLREIAARAEKVGEPWQL